MGDRSQVRLRSPPAQGLNELGFLESDGRRCIGGDTTTVPRATPRGGFTRLTEHQTHVTHCACRSYAFRERSRQMPTSVACFGRRRI